MLGFILSKLNLLILVTAIFAIVTFFMFGLSDIARVKEASELAFRVEQRASSIANSQGYCLSDSVPLDERLSIAGSTFYYVLKVSKLESVKTSGGNRFNLLIFSVYPREEIKKGFADSTYEPKSIAAESFRTKSELHLYSQTYNGIGYGEGNTPDVIESGEIYLDPQAIVPSDQLEFVKEIEGGKPKFYVIGCNSRLCEARKTFVGENLVHKKTLASEGGFFC